MKYEVGGHICDHLYHVCLLYNITKEIYHITTLIMWTVHKQQHTYFQEIIGQSCYNDHIVVFIVPTTIQTFK